MRLMLLSLLAACGGGSDPCEEANCAEAPGDDDDDGTDETGDTGPTFDGIVPQGFTIFAFYGVDDSGYLHGWTSATGDVLPQVSIVIYDSGDFDPCTVTFFIDDPNVAVSPWVFEDETEDITNPDMNHVGFDVPVDALVQTDGCEAWNVDEYGDVADLVFPHDWGVGIGELRSDIEDLVVEGIDGGEWMTDLYDDGNMVGASWQADVWEPTTWASHTAYANPVNNWVVEDDEAYIPAADILASQGTLPVGVYTLQPVYTWGFDTYFK